MDRLRILLVYLVFFMTVCMCQAQQTEKVVMEPDSLGRSSFESGHTFDQEPLTQELIEPLSQQGVVLEELPDSATIISQTEFLLDQLHAGNVLFPSYPMDGGMDGTATQRKFSHGMIAASQREDLIGLMGIERGMLGYSVGYGPLTLQAYATADKYASFHNLTTVFGVGGSLTLDVTDWMSVTAFGAYYSKAPYMGMAAYPYINTSNYGGYMTFKPSGTFGMSLGVRRDYDPITRRYYTNPVVMPSIKVKNAVFSVDFGPVINDVMHLFNRPKMPSGPMVPPGPRLLKPAGPLK